MKFRTGTVIQGASSKKIYVVKQVGDNRQACLKCLFSYINNDVYYCAAHKCVKEFGRPCDVLLEKGQYFRLFKEGL